MKRVLEGLECRRCEFPYSADIAIPPTEQRIPMAALYSAASAGLAERGRELREKGDVDRARQELERALELGLLLFEEPGRGRAWTGTGAGCETISGATGIRGAPHP